MTPRAASPAVWIAATLALASAPAAFAGAWSLEPGEHYAEFRSGFFSTDSYLNQDGERRPLAQGGDWEERTLASHVELGWTPRLTFLLGIPAKSVTRLFGGTWAGRRLPSATGLGDARVGVRYRLLNQGRAAALELDWKLPLGYEDDPFLGRADSVRCGDTTGDGDSLDVNCARQVGIPRLGDGQQDVTLGLHLGTAIPRGFVQFSGGYRLRTEGFQDQIVASADLGLWIFPSVLLAGRYEGEIAAQEGARPTEDPDRHRLGPQLVYRVDDRLDLFVSSLHTASAVNALRANEFFVGVAFKHTKLNRQQGFLGGSAAP